MTKLGDLYKIQIDKDGKVKVACDEAKKLARKPVNQRYAKPKTRFAKPREVSNV